MTVATLSASEQTAAIQRRAMVDSQLRTNDVTDPLLVAALSATPREPHLPETARAAAYIDRAIPLGGGRALNPPLTTARLIADAGIAAGQHVLLIGAATGYCAALLAAMGARVTAVEAQAELAAIGRTATAHSEKVHWVEGPLAEGAPGAAPFDAMIVDGAIESLPSALLAQLRPGARIATGLADGSVTRIARAVAVESGAPVAPYPFADLECVHLPGFAPPPRFTF
jgi:protein-L-isoaspartate(D-aspartate) O-methyltransferase